MKIPFENNEEYYDEIYPDIWIMHNHKWSLYCWEKYRLLKDIPSTLIHLDYHWDAINDYSGKEETIKDMNLSIMKEVLLEHNSEIRKDSFIAPAVIRGYINRVDFHCFQEDSIGFDDELLKKYQVIQNIHNKIESLIHSVGTQDIILDLDLDIFNTIGFRTGNLWSEEEIINYIHLITPLIQQSKIITIAMSYGFTGTNEVIEYLTKLVIPLIIKIKEQKNNIQSK